MELATNDAPLSQPTPAADAARNYETNRGRLKILLEYELAAALRYRRFASVVVFTTPFEDLRLFQLLEDAIRDSDEIFDLGSSTVILMGDTDRGGAVTAVERILAQFKNELKLHYAVACYPSDGNDSKELLISAYQRLSVE